MEENTEKVLEVRTGRKRKKSKIEETNHQTKGEGTKLQNEGSKIEKSNDASLCSPLDNTTGTTSNNNCASNSNINQPYVKTKNDKRGGTSGGNNNNKFNFRAPQQFQISKKKNWNKRHQKGLYGNPTLIGSCSGGSGIIHSQQISKADVENLPNIKNQISHRQTGCNSSGQKSIKQQQCYAKRKILGGVGGGVLSIRSKFFLSDKRPRKEIIIPPTKFLLGGNISDPLNLNSLQEEAQSGNATPSTTPRQSPVTTPPKIEVIIPPNIHDPLHLLDPVDSIEYEKQLVSPMKRKHRHRKKKQKRKRLISTSSGLSMISTPTELNFKNALSNIFKTDKESEDGSNNEVSTTSNNNSQHENNPIKTEENVSTTVLKIDEINNSSSNLLIKANTASKVAPQANTNEYSNSSKTTINLATEKRRSEQIDRITKELRLDLDITIEQHKQNMINIGRKRKSSEAGSCKNKFRRLENMDKIVSPVVPQPGAWKRPPRNTPSGARKNSRIRSISNSETDLVSPTEESKIVPSQLISDANILSEEKIESLTGTEVLNDLTKDLEIEKSSIEPSTEHKKKVEGESIKYMPKFKPDSARYQFGNYDRYSGFNTVNEFIDIRLEVFQRNADLFVNKDILDIGCNVGHITIALAKKLSPKSILGIDIDPKLISRARRNISLYVRIPNEKIYESLKTKIEVEIPVASPLTTTPKETKNILEEKIKFENFGELVKKQLAELQKNSSDTIRNISKSKLKRKIYFELRRKNRIFQKQRYAEQRRIQGNSMETFPISFPICYGMIPSHEKTNSLLDNSPSINTEILGTITGSSGGNITGGENSNSVLSTTTTSCNSANVTPVRSLNTLITSVNNITDMKSIKNEFPKNVFFQQCNYVLKDENSVNNEQQQYDLILCLSVTKWIHLNFGDNGLKLAFKRMFNQLRPGGKLILEAQNWASYKKKKNLTETIYNNYNSIEFFPNKFHEYLLSNEVGFSHSYTLGVPRHLSKGFCRPIQLYAKGDFTPNHVRWSDAYYPQTPYEAYRGIYASVPRPPYPLWGSWDLIRTPRGNSSSCRQTPYYNPLETDSYLPSYDTEVLNRHYVFASPLYQTVWSPPASLRNSSSHTPVFGSVREVDNDIASGSNNRTRHVYLPNDESNSPKIVNGAFNSIREEADQDSNSPARTHVYANCDSSSSPRDGSSDNDQILPITSGVVSSNTITTTTTNERSHEIVSDSNDSETI